jgi:hypothetical protein
MPVLRRGLPLVIAYVLMAVALVAPALLVGGRVLKQCEPAVMFHLMLAPWLRNEPENVARLPLVSDWPGAR